MADSRRIPDWVLSKRSRNYSSCRLENSSDDRSSVLTKAAQVAATAFAAYVGYQLNRSLREYGWDGTLRLIWEGDPYDSELREAVDKLEDAEFDLLATHRIDDRLEGLETSLDASTTIASSDDLPVDKLWNRVWMEHPANRLGSTDNPLTIERTLADMSLTLDNIAANVDGLILSPASGSSGDKIRTGNNFLAQRVKERKKKISRAIVSEMERCDALLASYQVLRERTK